MKLSVRPQINLYLHYSGAESEENRIDFYDASQALAGFERAISLTTHLILNNEVIVQSPSLKGASIFAYPAEDGSWRQKIAIAVVGGLFGAAVAPQNSVLGHLMVSAYDYVISEALGFHVDFDKTLGKQYKELQSQGTIEKTLDQSRFDSVMEKAESGIKQIHRPIVFSETADRGRIYWQIGAKKGGLNSTFSPESYDYISTTIRREDQKHFCGVVTSFNSNTYRGRIYIKEFARPIAFEIAPELRSTRSSLLFGRSLLRGIQRQYDEELLCFKAFRNESRTGALKSLYIVELEGQRKQA